MIFLKFIPILCELPSKTKANHFYWISALSIFVLFAGIFYAPFWMDLQGYRSADWDFSNFMHAVPAWSVKYFHEFPLWDPYLRGGSSLIGNPQNPAPFSITFLMSLLAGPLEGLKLGDILNTVIGMMGMYLLMGQFNSIWIARVLSGIIWGINGNLVFHVTQGHFMWLMAMYWPWMLIFFMKSLDERLWIYLAGFVLSLQFWGGGTYLFAFAIVVFGMLTVFLAIQDKKLRYLWRFAEMMGAFVIFSAPRLFMVMESLYRFPRVTVDQDTQVPGDIFYNAFICRDQINAYIPGLKIDEFSAYVGIIPVVLAMAICWQWKKYWPYMLVLMISLVMGLGDSPFSPFWPFFHLLGAGYFHFSTRSFLISVFLIAIAAAVSLSHFVLKWKDKYPIIMVMACAASVFVMYDLFVVLSPIQKLTLTNARQYQDFAPLTSFTQMDVTDKQRYRFGNSSMMDQLVRNIGISNGYDALSIPPHVHPRNVAGYPGEVYLQGGFGQKEIASWQPNRWDIKVHVFQDDILLINQNFDPGWRTDPSRKVLNVGGVCGVAVTPQDREIVFYYLPFGFILGLWVSVLGLIAMGWDIMSRVRFKNQIGGKR